MRNTIFRKFFTITLSILILVYVGYQVYSINKKTVSTETATYSTIKDSINADAYVVRDETIIYNDKDGVVNYFVGDGDKISNNGKIASLYKNSDDVIIKKQLEQIDKELSQLKNLNMVSNAAIANPNAINAQISDCIKESISDINDNKLQNLDEDKSNVLYLINQRNIITGKVSDFNDRIQELQKQKSSLESSYNKEICSILSPKSGYFVSVTDGIEGVTDYNNVKSLKPSDITDALSKKEQGPARNVLGKIIGGVNWWVTCNVPYQEAKNIDLGSNLSITFPFASISDVPCRVVGINPDNEQNQTAVILECDYMNRELSLLRSESISINLNSYSGIVISKKSLHEDVVVKEKTDESGNTTKEEKEVQGVYVLYGSEMVFKQVIPIFANSSHVVCKSDPEEGELFNGDTIKAYDQVITEGAGLYNGRIIK